MGPTTWVKQLPHIWLPLCGLISRSQWGLHFTAVVSQQGSAPINSRFTGPGSTVRVKQREGKPTPKHSAAQTNQQDKTSARTASSATGTAHHQR